jgi:para-aminobenzoate synthetase component 1
MKFSGTTLFKVKLLQWANSFDVCCMLDSNNFPDKYGKYELLIAVGVEQSIRAQSGNAFAALEVFYAQYQDWMFGLLGYDLKNETEDLKSENIDQQAFPDLYFFIPKYLIVIENDEIRVLKGDAQLLEDIDNIQVQSAKFQDTIEFQSRISKTSYLEQVSNIKDHIHKGNIYELTFCQEFYSEHAVIDPLTVFQSLNKLSPAPFAGFFKTESRYILSASPERFLCKNDTILTSQPIKGTAKRSQDAVEDEQIKSALLLNEKERAENVMIVDLVRNDLTKNAVKGTVVVNELFGIYSFPQVHQMISTISCELDPVIHPIQAIKNTFPMGSMTGAPKIKAMQLIEQYEHTKRNAFSGSIGYITPAGDFDFNVVIRSLLYNSEDNYLSFQVGGAITEGSEPEKEYEESLLKGAAIIQTLKGPQ